MWRGSSTLSQIPLPAAALGDASDVMMAHLLRVLPAVLCAWIRRPGPSKVSTAWVPGWGGWRRFAGRSWSVLGVAGAGLGCLQAADEGVEAGGEPLVAVG